MISAIVAVIIFFEPNLNIGAPKPISIFQALKQGQPALPLLMKWIVTVGAIFGAMFFLIGLEPKPKKKQEKSKKKAKNISE